MSSAWIACGMALISASMALADEPDEHVEPNCSACEELVGIAEKELGFELGRRVYPDRSVLDTERVLLPSPVEPNWGGVFRERAGAVRFVNSRRTSAIQIWGEVVPVAGG